MYWQYTADAYYQIVRARYYISPENERFIIDSVKTIGSTEVTAHNGIIYIKPGGKDKEELFGMNDIPAHLTSGINNTRFSSLALNEGTSTLIFTISGQDSNNVPVVKVFNYNIKDKSFKLLDTIDKISNENNIGVTGLTIDNTGQWTAVEFFTQTAGTIKSHAVVYNIKTGEKKAVGALFTPPSQGSINTLFWDGSRLVLETATPDQTVRYLYDIKEASINNF